MDVEEVWSAYQARILAFLRSRVSDPADAEDILQEISIKVVTGLPTLREPSKLKSWLFQTAHNTIVDFYRKGSRAKQVHPDDLWYSENDPQARQELERCVDPFIAALPPQTAALLTAIDIEGQSQKDYAAARGVAYSTLKSQVQAGRAALRLIFEECCDLTFDARGAVAGYQPKSGDCEKC